MLKLVQNITPTWSIDGVNKEFKTDYIIWAVQSIYVDGTLISSSTYSFSALTITLDVAPATSVVLNYFKREVGSINWNWMVTLWDLKTSFYRKIGRVNRDLTIPNNISSLYPEDYVKTELRKSLKRIVNISPESNRIQQYTLKGTNWYVVTDETTENVVTLEQSLTNEIEGMFFVWNWIAYNYYGLNWSTFQVKGIDLSEIGDKVIVGSRIPYGAQKLSEVIVDGIPYNYTDQRAFSMIGAQQYTIVKDWQGNEYLFVSYNEDEVVTVVKYVPDLNHFSNDNDIIDMVEEYTDVIVYDTAYKLLRDKEDERWIELKRALWTGKKEGMLYEYQSFVKSLIKRTRARIWFASTYN